MHTDFLRERPNSSEPEITVLLARVRNGDRLAMEIVANWLDSRLRTELRNRNPWTLHGLVITQVVNEVFVKLLQSERWMWSDNRRHLIHIGLRAIRQVIADHARGASTQKRGGDASRLGLDIYLDSLSQRGVNYLDLHDALERLREFNLRQFEIVQMRYFGGFTISEISSHLGISISTVESDWRSARGWLYRELMDG